MLMVTSTGFKPRTRVTFQLTAPTATPEKECGPRPNAANTASGRPTTMNQVSSRARLLAELLSDLSGPNFPELASVLLPQLGSREPTARRRRRRPTTTRKRKSRAWSESESDFDSENSASFSSNQNSSYYTDSSEEEMEESSIRGMQAIGSHPAARRLAQIPGQENFQPLGARN